MNKIEIDISASGIGTLKVDGKDISRSIGAVNIRCRPGQLTKVFIALVGDVEVKVDGEVLPSGIVKLCSLDGRERLEKTS